MGTKSLVAAASAVVCAVGGLLYFLTLWSATYFRLPDCHELLDPALKQKTAGVPKATQSEPEGGKLETSKGVSPAGGNLIEKATSNVPNGAPSGPAGGTAGIVSYLGARPLCKSEFVARSFSGDAIRQYEVSLAEWMMKWNAVMEKYENEHAIRRNGPMKGRSPFSHGLSKKEYRESRFFHENYRVALPPEGPTCGSALKFFGPAKDIDQQKSVCWSDSLFKDDACTIISIGSNNMWGFEVGAFKQTRCRIHTFDCTSKDSMPKSIRSRTTFYKKCIGGADHKNYISWGTMLRLIGAKQAPEYLKIDVEGYEYETMRNLLSSKDLPNQIAMEIHSKTDTPLVWKDRWKDLSELTGFALMMYAGGYRLVSVNWKTACGHCLEVLWGKIFC